MIISILGIRFAGLLFELLYASADFVGIMGTGSELVLLISKLPFFMFLLQAELIPLLKGLNPVLGIMIGGMSFIIAALWRRLGKREDQERETFLKVTALLTKVAQGMEEDKRLREDVREVFRGLDELNQNWKGLEVLSHKLDVMLQLMQGKK